MDDRLICICDLLYDIDEFDGEIEFEKLKIYLNYFIYKDYLEEVDVEIKYSNSLIEKWYQCKSFKHKWRLVYPNESFGGLFEKIK